MKIIPETKEDWIQYAATCDTEIARLRSEIEDLKTMLLETDGYIFMISWVNGDGEAENDVGPFKTLSAAEGHIENYIKKNYNFGYAAIHGYRLEQSYYDY